MNKPYPSRNSRSKGIKVKHVLQICVLLAVCFWLVYQVKHSHENRREEDEKVLQKVQTDGEIQRFGRKDLPRVTAIATDIEKHGEDEEEKEAEAEENKHEEDDPEREDGRVGEREVDQGDGDNEIDENEPEKTLAELEREEEEVDEHKEREEKNRGAEENHAENEENEDAGREEHSESEGKEDAGHEAHNEPEEKEDVVKEDHDERDVALDDQDHHEHRTNTREAQEELYKADDASSEVAQDQSFIPKIENMTIGHSNEIWAKVNFGHENETKTSDNADALIKTEVKAKEDNDGGTSNVTVTEQKENEISLTKPDDSSLQNASLPNLHDDKTQSSANSTAVEENSAILSSNETQMVFDSNLYRNKIFKGTTGDEEPNTLGSVLENTNKSKLAADDRNQSEAAADSNKTENINSNVGESLSNSDTTLATYNMINDTDAIEAEKDSSVGNETQGEKTENSGTDGSDESTNAESYDKGMFTFQRDPIDESDAILTEEEKEYRTDLGTLPEIRSDFQNMEDTVDE